MIVLMFKKSDDYRVGAHLHLREIHCQCTLPHCHYTLLSRSLLNRWDFLRAIWGEAISISSFFRCQQHNVSKGVGGKYNSRHTIGSAFDLVLPKDPTKRKQFIALCEWLFPFTYVNEAKNFIHCDVRDE